MKLKSLLIAGALCLFSGSMFAQESNEEITFKPHATLSLGGGLSHTLGEAKFGDLNSFAGQVALGYHFNPVFGMRFGVQGFTGKGGWPASSELYKYNQLSGNVDALFNLSNLIAGYKYNRPVSLSAFAGLGLNHAYNNDEANAIDHGSYKMEYLWQDSKNFIQGRAGLILGIRLSDAVDFNIEGNANILSDKFNSKKAGNADWYFNVLAGLTFRLGKAYTKTVTYVPAPVVEEPKVVEPVKEEPKPVVKPEPKREPMRINVFFTINKVIAADSEMQKVRDLAAYMKKYPETKVVLTGYADKGTGNARINARLAAGRAQAVADALNEMGIDRARMTVDSKGDKEQPFAENDMNRVTIGITD